MRTGERLRYLLLQQIALQHRVNKICKCLLRIMISHTANQIINDLIRSGRIKINMLLDVSPQLEANDCDTRRQLTRLFQ